MKVVIAKNFTRQGKKWKEGQEVEFTNEVALKLIKQGKAVDPTGEHSLTPSEVE